MSRGSIKNLRRVIGGWLDRLLLGLKTRESADTNVSRTRKRPRRRALKLDNGSLAHMRLGSGDRHDHANRKRPSVISEVSPTNGRQFEPAATTGVCLTTKLSHAGTKSNRLQTATFPGVDCSALVRPCMSRS
jgi:hypothetical protein